MVRWTKQKLWTRLICTALMLCLCCPMTAGAQEVPELYAPVGVAMDTVRAARGEISKITIYNGSIVPYVDEIAFSEDGTVEKIHVIPGQKVKAGDVLITLDHEWESEQIEALEKSIQRTRQEGEYVDRLTEIDMQILRLELEQLLDQRPVNEQAVELKRLQIEELELNHTYTLDLRQMELDQLEKQLAEYEERVINCVLRAPFDGRVMHIAPVEAFSYVKASTPLIALADDTQILIETDYVSDQLLSNAHDVYALIGDGRVEIENIPIDIKEYAARVLAREVIVSQFTLQIKGEAPLIGQYAAVCVVTNYSPNALLVPSNAVFTEGSEKYLYVVENGSRMRVSVKTGITTDWQTEIVEGLKEGAIVYVQE